MKPRKPLKRSTKPLTRTARLRSRGKPKRFAARRDPKYCEWIRSIPCILTGHPRSFGCSSTVECAHVRTRAAGGDDRGNTLPLCARHHRAQHLWGIKSFEEFFDLDLRARAKALETQYRKAA